MDARKSPCDTLMHGLLTVALSAQLAGVADPAAIEALRTEARRAEARFERVSRESAPLSWGGSHGTDCDEIVGRFCLRFDSVSTAPAAAENERVARARGEAVEAARRFFSAAPGSIEAAGPLVRLLIRDGRAPEAVTVAAGFAEASSDTLMSELLSGYASHWAGDDLAAERHLVSGLARLSDEERREWLSPDWLLGRRQAARVRALGPAARTEYERRFWLLADPLWATPANERWIEHVARHVEGKLMSEAPLVPGMTRWGRDLAELTVRYGTPSSRARTFGSAPGFDAGMVEYWDSAQRAFDPVDLLDGVPATPPPGERPLLYAATARSSYGLQTHRVLELDHQVTRLLRGDSVVLRVDAALPIESLGGMVRGTLVVYDTAFTSRREARGPLHVRADTAHVALLVGLPAGGGVYGAEILAGRVAGRARYRVGTSIPPTGPALSDLLISNPFPWGRVPENLEDPLVRPLTALVFSPGDTLGIYAELYRAGAGTNDIEVGLERAGRPSLLGRLAGWVGRGLGLGGGDDAPTIRWSASADEGPHVLAFNIQLEDAAGLHDLVVRVTLATGETAEARRLILIRR